MSGRLRIAVADDEPLLRRYFAEILPEMGHEVIGVAAGGVELAEICRSQQPDLVITDIKMPDGDGIEAACALLGERAVPVILVSAYHDPELVRRAADSGVMAYLVKPIERADLEVAVEVARRRFAESEAHRQEAARLRSALEDRKLIERAKGILMTTGLSEDEAHRRMQKMASDRNRKLVEVAEMVLKAEGAIGLLGKEQS